MTAEQLIKSARDIRIQIFRGDIFTGDRGILYTISPNRFNHKEECLHARIEFHSDGINCRGTLEFKDSSPLDLNEKYCPGVHLTREVESPRNWMDKLLGKNPKTHTEYLRLDSVEDHIVLNMWLLSQIKNWIAEEYVNFSMTEQNAEERFLKLIKPTGEITADIEPVKLNDLIK
jgi:hypothetical protein